MILPRKDIAAGDVVLGLASSGVHSNGFSLVRKIVAQEKPLLHRWRQDRTSPAAISLRGKIRSRSTAPTANPARS